MSWNPLGSDPESRQNLLVEIAQHLREGAVASERGDVLAFLDALEHVVQLVIELDLAEPGTVRPNPRYLEHGSRPYVSRESKLRDLEDHRVLLYEALERAKDREDMEELGEVAEQALPAIEVEIVELNRQLSPRSSLERG